MSPRRTRARRRPLEALVRERAASAMRPAPQFWDEFRGLAAAHPQAGEPVALPFLPAPLRWAAAAAAVLVVAGLGVLSLGPGPAEREAATIRSLTITAAYESAMILRDSATQATIVWLNGVDLGQGDGG